MADEDEWGFPIALDERDTKSKALTGDHEDDWGFASNPAQSSRGQAVPATQAESENESEDEWGFSTGLSKDSAPIANKDPLDEDEWGFPTKSANQISPSDPSDLLAKWGFGPVSPEVAEKSNSSTSNESSKAVESLFEGWKTATRTSKLGTSLSTFTTILSNLDIPGPQHLLFNINDRATKIGQGTQFTVFLDNYSAEAADGSGRHVEGQGIVIKRVRISKASLKEQKNLAENEKYRETLRHLELEVLSLGLLRHRNIVRLNGWGYDYEDRYTPIPVLFMEAALAPLTEFLQAEKEGEGELITLGQRRWDIKYHLALDIAAGLEAIHAFNVIHGDIKPDNVLIFRCGDRKVPFVGKLSDFGVCVDMKVEGVQITSETYLGTPAWTGSEVGVGQWRNDIHGKFEPSLLKSFDSYSFGLTLLSIFGSYGEVPEITKEPGPERAFGLFMEIEEVLEKTKGCPEEIINTLKEVSKKLLAIKPSERPLPSPSLIYTDLPSYTNWVHMNTTAAQLNANTRGRGHQYWFGLDQDVLNSLDEQYMQRERKGEDSDFAAETLFGLAQACSYRPVKDQYGKILKYLLAAAKKGSIPARAICAKVYEAFNTRLDIEEKTLSHWQKEALRDGFLFAHHSLLGEDEFVGQWQQFRDEGGYCDDPFLTLKNVVGIAKDVNKLRKWLVSNNVDGAIDSAGNTMMHVCAALGQSESLKLLLSQLQTVPINENGETPLYKACQAGHTKVVRFLLEHGHHTTPSRATGVSPLHWLFLFPETDIRAIAEALVAQGGADVNFLIKPTRDSCQANQMKHFPFEWPYGTPFHWAAFARNRNVMDVLLELGADIDSPYDNGHHGTTPLAQAVYAGDVTIVQYLLAKGAKVLAKNNEGESLLHTMSIGAGNRNPMGGGKLSSWVRHGTWEERLQASKEIIRLLLKAGVNIESKRTTVGKHTPLLLAAMGASRNESVVAALLDAGADTMVMDANDDTNLLHEWCATAPNELAYPHVYAEILEEIVAKTKDLELKGSSLEETALHMLVKQELPVPQLLEHIKLLISDPAHHANINARDRDGDTPLMKICVTSPRGMADKLNFMLEQGAKPDLMNDYQENVIQKLVNNRALMDADSLSALKIIFSHVSFTTSELQNFIAETDLTALVDTCTSARAKTLEYLLSLGFDQRVNEVVTNGGVETTALDQAFFAADVARLRYIRYASALVTEEEIQEADKANQLYATHETARDTYGGPSAQRAREVYWSFPKIFQLLQKHGAKRILLNNRGPSWTDATALPALGMKKESQPNLEHWKSLYDLDVVDKDFEEEAWTEFKDEYSYIDEDDYDKLEVPVMVFERWPKVKELLPDKNGWYKGLLRDGRRVEVKMGDERIEALRDLKGRALSARER